MTGFNFERNDVNNYDGDEEEGRMMAILMKYACNFKIFLHRPIKFKLNVVVVLFANG